MSELRRTGDREERGERCVEEKGKKLKEKKKANAEREIYCRVRIDHIKKKVKGLETENKGVECLKYNIHSSTCV